MNIRIQEVDMNSLFGCLVQTGSILVPMDVGQGSLKYYKKDDFPQYFGFDPVQQLNISNTDTSGNSIRLNVSSKFVFIRYETDAKEHNDDVG